MGSGRRRYGGLHHLDSAQATQSRKHRDAAPLTPTCGASRPAGRSGPTSTKLRRTPAGLELPRTRGRSGQAAMRLSFDQGSKQSNGGKGRHSADVLGPPDALRSGLCNRTLLSRPCLSALPTHFESSAGYASTPSSFTATSRLVGVSTPSAAAADSHWVLSLKGLRRVERRRPWGDQAALRESTRGCPRHRSS